MISASRYAVLNVTGVDTVSVNAAGTGSVVTAGIGADLSAFTADIEFDVVDNAAGLIAEMNGTDPAGFLTEANSITVNEGADGTFVNAADGALLNSFTANVDFDVADTAQNIANEVNGVNGPVGSLNEAGEVIVETGSAVNAADALAIQGISGYTGAGDLDIADDAAALIAAGDAVLNVVGVDTVTVNAAGTGSVVTAGVGADLSAFTADIEFDVVDNAAGLIAEMNGTDPAGFLTEANSITVNDLSTGRVVGANDGAILASFTADVDFDVVDSAQAIAAELSAHGAGSLDEAADVVASGGIVDAEDAAAIMQISEYNTAGSQFEISDDVASVISAGSGVIENDGVF